jgi:hypothetical protein
LLGDGPIDRKTIDEAADALLDRLFLVSDACMLVLFGTGLVEALDY